jgi:hypothetical protein
MKKIIILSLIVCSLLFVAVDPAAAADRTIPDDKGDVIGVDEMGEEITTSEFVDVANLDILEMTYTRTGKSVTLTLKVDGEIEDRGNLDDIEHMLLGDREIDLIYYTLLLTTSDSEYLIIYINKNCNISYGASEESEAIDTFTINNKDTLSVTFDLLDDTETYDYLESTVLYTKFPDLSAFGDPEDPDFDWTSIDLEALNFEEFVDESIDEGTNGGETSGDDNDNEGQSGSSEGLDSGLLMFLAIIGIIVIVGVAVVIYIVRR